MSGFTGHSGGKRGVDSASKVRSAIDRLLDEGNSDDMNQIVRDAVDELVKDSKGKIKSGSKSHKKLEEQRRISEFNRKMRLLMQLAASKLIEDHKQRDKLEELFKRVGIDLTEFVKYAKRPESKHFTFPRTPGGAIDVEAFLQLATLRFLSKGSAGNRLRESKPKHKSDKRGSSPVDEVDSKSQKKHSKHKSPKKGSDVEPQDPEIDLNIMKSRNGKVDFMAFMYEAASVLAGFSEVAARMKYYLHDAALKLSGDSEVDTGLRSRLLDAIDKLLEDSDVNVSSESETTSLSGKGANESKSKDKLKSLRRAAGIKLVEKTSKGADFKSSLYKSVLDIVGRTEAGHKFMKMMRAAAYEMAGIEQDDVDMSSDSGPGIRSTIITTINKLMEEDMGFRSTFLPVADKLMEESTGLRSSFMTVVDKLMEEDTGLRSTFLSSLDKLMEDNTGLRSTFIDTVDKLMQENESDPSLRDSFHDTVDKLMEEDTGLRSTFLSALNKLMEDNAGLKSTFLAAIDKLMEEDTGLRSTFISSLDELMEGNTGLRSAFLDAIDKLMVEDTGLRSTFLDAVDKLMEDNTGLRSTFLDTVDKLMGEDTGLRSTFLDTIDKLMEKDTGLRSTFLDTIDKLMDDPTESSHFSTMLRDAVSKLLEDDPKEKLGLKEKLFSIVDDFAQGKGLSSTFQDTTTRILDASDEGVQLGKILDQCVSKLMDDYGITLGLRSELFGIVDRFMESKGLSSYIIAAVNRLMGDSQDKVKPRPLSGHHSPKHKSSHSKGSGHGVESSVAVKDIVDAKDVQSIFKNAIEKLMEDFKEDTKAGSKLTNDVHGSLGLRAIMFSIVDNFMEAKGLRSIFMNAIDRLAGDPEDASVLRSLLLDVINKLNENPENGAGLSSTFQDMIDKLMEDPEDDTGLGLVFAQVIDKLVENPAQSAGLKATFSDTIDKLMSDSGEKMKIRSLLHSAVMKLIDDPDSDSTLAKKLYDAIDKLMDDSQNRSGLRSVFLDALMKLADSSDDEAKKELQPHEKFLQSPSETDEDSELRSILFDNMQDYIDVTVEDPLLKSMLHDTLDKLRVQSGLDLRGDKKPRDTAIVLMDESENESLLRAVLNDAVNALLEDSDENTATKPLPSDIVSKPSVDGSVIKGKNTEQKVSRPNTILEPKKGSSSDSDQNHGLDHMPYDSAMRHPGKQSPLTNKKPKIVDTKLKVADYSNDFGTVGSTLTNVLNKLMED